jgi:hypothetical protein
MAPGYSTLQPFCDCASEKQGFAPCEHTASAYQFHIFFQLLLPRLTLRSLVI